MRLRPIALVATLASLLLAAVAPAATSDFSFGFSTKKPAAPAALSVRAVFDGTRVIDDLRLVLPAGTRVDTSAGPRCSASLASSTAGGFTKSCPAATKVGTGSGQTILNDVPVRFALTFFNAPKGFDVDLSVGSTVAFLSTFRLRGASTLDFDLHLAKELKARITGFSFKLGKAGKAYFRTPKSCPSSGHLTAKVLIRAAGATQTDTATVAC